MNAVILNHFMNLLHDGHKQIIFLKISSLEQNNMAVLSVIGHYIIINYIIYNYLQFTNITQMC